MKTSLALFAVTVALFVGWVWWERRTSDPAIDFGLVVSKSMGPLYVAAFAMGAVMIGSAEVLVESKTASLGRAELEG